NDEPLVFHHLRHSFSTWLAGAGVPKETRNRLMGHSRGDVGETHYTAESVPLLMAAVETIRLDLDGPKGQESGPDGGEKLSEELSQGELAATGTDGLAFEDQEVGCGSQAVRHRFANSSGAPNDEGSVSNLAGIDATAPPSTASAKPAIGGAETVPDSSISE